MNGVGRWRWPALAAALVIAVAGVVVARSGGKPDPREAEIREGGTVRVAATMEPSGFNPNTSADSGPGIQDVAVSVYPSVFRVHPDFSVRLEEAFMAGADLTGQDPQTITYRIRPEARWSDGVPITADDFRFLWEHLNGTNPKIDAATVTGYERIRTVTGSADGKTVTVVFGRPFAEWRGLFTQLVPAHYVRRQPGGWNRGLSKHPENIPSGGPFRIAGFTPGETVTLVRNDNYWGPRAHLDRIQFRLVPDSDAQLDALRNDEADLIRPQSTTDLVNAARRLPGVQSQMRSSLGFEHLTFNLKHPALAELAVRQAIATAIDTGQVVDRLLVPLNPDARVLGNRIWLGGQQPYQDHAGGYGKGDTQAARQLLERAGWALGGDGIYRKGGRRLHLRMATFNDDPRRKAEDVLLQAQLGAAGIQVSLHITARYILLDEWLPRASSTSPTSPGAADRSPSPATRTPTGPAGAATTASSPTQRLTPSSNKPSVSRTQPGPPTSATRSTSASGTSSRRSRSTSCKISSPGATTCATSPTTQPPKARSGTSPPGRSPTNEKASTLRWLRPGPGGESVTDDGGEGLVRSYYQEALNLGRFDRLDDLLAEEFLDHEELRGIPPTRDGVNRKYRMLRAGFSDFGFTIEDLFSAGDRVAARVTVRGTHDGEFMGRPATGRSFVVTSVGSSGSPTAG